jgi:hypothetical protein
MQGDLLNTIGDVTMRRRFVLLGLICSMGTLCGCCGLFVDNKKAFFSPGFENMIAYVAVGDAAPTEPKEERGRLLFWRKTYLYDFHEYYRVTNREDIALMVSMLQKMNGKSDPDITFTGTLSLHAFVSKDDVLCGVATVACGDSCVSLCKGGKMRDGKVCLMTSEVGSWICDRLPEYAKYTLDQMRQRCPEEVKRIEGSFRRGADELEEIMGLD